ncbi:LacI family DNA-binding transcriptional regulator [Dactylosporangium sp. NPDC051541]|uniref:LacI family DNA-binding transcriptional regulator n=1 Tax=Dactylosporangium sp. NPDC051541 TaxID=3363977 RepID=UPI00379DC20A
MRRTKVGIRDVAIAAGVSVTTVSHTLNNLAEKRISPDTRRRVHEAAQRLGYTPNGLARGLRLQRSGTVGLISDEIATTPHAGKIILGAQEAVARHGGLLMVLDTGGAPALEDRAARLLMRHQVDGVLLAAMYHRQVTVPAALHGVPLVLLNALAEDRSLSWVVPDEVGGGRAATHELLAAGHRRIAFINDSDDIPARHGRLRGWHERLHEEGIAVASCPVIDVVPGAPAGREAALTLLRSPEPPTGIFAFNDAIAMGVYQAAAELGLRIPADLSVVGFDDLQLISEGLHPGLTTIALPHYEMGVWAAEQLYDRINAPAGTQPPVRHRTLEGPLVRRSSVAPPPRR